MDLKFDNMSVDTTLAREYLEKEAVLEKSYGKGQFFDGKQNHENYDRVHNIPVEVLLANLENFGVKLNENKNLIGQLEYLLRKIPIEDTIAQIYLILQQINYMRSVSPIKVEFHHESIVMKYNSPLLLLGYIANKMLQTDHMLLRHDDTSKVICRLFAQLCHDAGLPVVSTPMTTTTSVKSNIIFEVPIAAVGVISELSDIDSAVDVFLTSSEHVPWRLQKILVQESVYKQFKNALIWQCNLNNKGEGKAASSDSTALEYNGRPFVLDVVATMTPPSRAVTIEAYRTRKELKLLLKQYQPHYLSLWATDIAEINEITHSVPSLIIWVNNYGDFRGPPKITESLYFHEEGSAIETYVSGLSELKAAWAGLTYDVRREILCNALDKCATTDPTNDIFVSVKNDLRKIVTNAPNAFIDVGNNYVCLGISAPSTKLFRRSMDFVNTAFFISVLKGNAYALTGLEEKYIPIVDILRKAGAPIINLDTSVKSKSSCLLYACNYANDSLVDATQTTKVIWTNSGTIFT